MSDVTTNPAAPPAPVEGSCLCGAVTYTLSGGFGMRGVCNCISCKKHTGSAFSTNSVVDKKDITVHTGQASVKIYKDTTPDSGNFLERCFCAECGSTLFTYNPATYPDKMFVPAGSMDGAMTGSGVDVEAESQQKWSPQLALFTKHKPAWCSVEVGMSREEQ